MTIQYPKDRDGLRYCSKCASFVPLGSFTNRSSGRLHRWCNSCKSTAERSRYQPTGTGLHGGAVRRLTDQERKDNAYFCQLKYRYGVSREQYNEMFDRQGGLCAICGQPNSGLSQRLYVDHCHETGRVRWLLCQHCNTGLGMFKDNPQLLRKAADLLERQ